MIKPRINFQSDFALKDFPLLKAESEINNWLAGNTGSVYILRNEKAEKVSLNFTRTGLYAVNKEVVKKIVVLYSIDNCSR
jgi:hypothetical protein